MRFRSQFPLRLFAFFLCVGGLLGSSSAARAAHKYILLPTSAKLYVKPSRKAHVFLPTAWDKRGTHKTHLLWAVTGTKGQWLQLQYPSKLRSHWAKKNKGPYVCYPKPDLDSFANLSFYVRKQDTAWITQKPIGLLFRGGTWLRLPAGVALHPVKGAKGTFRAHIKGWTFALKLPRKKLSRFFPKQAAPLKTGSGGKRYRGISFLKVGPHKLVQRDPMEIFRIKQVQKGQQLVLERSCLRVRATKPTYKMRPFRPTSVGMLGTIGGSSNVKQGALVYWSTGAKAGVLTGGFNDKASRKHPAKHKGRICRSHRLMPEDWHYRYTRSGRFQVYRQKIAQRPTSPRELVFCFRRKDYKSSLAGLLGSFGGGKSLEEAFKNTKGFGFGSGKRKQKKK